MAYRRSTRRTNDTPTHRQTPDEKLLALAHARFKQAADADEKQRQRELDDLRFYAGDQWPGDLITMRAGQAAVGDRPPVPARPCLVVNKALQPVAQILNQEREMDMGAELIPADDFEGLSGPIDDSEIELREGLLRRIQRAPETSDARTWAFERAAVAGRGYWYINTKYAPGKTRDKDLSVERIFNQASVSLDPSHEQPDGSDAEWGFIGTDMPWDQYTAEFPKVADADNAVCSAEDDDEFRALGESAPGWFGFKKVKNRDGHDEESSTRFCRVVNYYYTARTTRALCTMPNGSMEWKDELPKGAPTPLDTREVVQKAIKWAKLDGQQILEQTEWEGPDIPIIKVVGRELQPYDDDRHVEGIVRPMRDSGQALNYTVSKAMELTVGLPPLAQWTMPAGADEGFEGEWQTSNTRTFGTLHYNEIDASGRQIVGKPERVVNGPIGVEPLFQSVGLLNEFINDTTLTPRAAVGDVDAVHKSGKALKMQIEQSQRGTSNFLDNQARSVRREATILNGLFYAIYGQRPGRIARILSGENEPQTVLIGQPFMHQDGKPQPVQMPAAVPGQPPPALPQGAKHYQLTENASFNLVVKVSKSIDTRREQEAQLVGGMIEANPALLNVFGDLYFKNLDGPGHREMAERMETVLAPPVQAMLKAKQGGQAPPSPELQQAQQQMQAMGQRLQELESGIAKAQLDAQTKLQVAQLDNETRFKIAAMQVQATLQTTQQKIDAQMAEASIEAETKKIAAVLDEKVGVAEQLSGHAHDAALQAQDHGHVRETQILEHAHERALSAQQAVHQQDAQQQQAQTQASAADQSHQQTLEQQSQAAALQPPPAAGAN